MPYVSKVETYSNGTAHSDVDTWLYSDDDARKRMAVTLSKHWNHFCRCVRWPPTSTNRNGTFSICRPTKIKNFLAPKKHTIKTQRFHSAKGRGTSINLSLCPLNCLHGHSADQFVPTSEQTFYRNS